jgi:hypothetical protein
VRGGYAASHVSGVRWEEAAAMSKQPRPAPEWNLRKLDRLVRDLDARIRVGFSEAKEIEDDQARDAAEAISEILGLWAYRLKECRK